MKFDSLIVALGTLVGMSGIAVSIANRAEAKVDAGCVECRLQAYFGGPTVVSCAAAYNPSSTGPQYCRFTSQYDCNAEGYGSCS